MSGTDVAALRQAVDQLGLTQRRVLILHYAEELTIPEIALVLDLAEQTVMSILADLQALARKALGVAPKDQESEPSTVAEPAVGQSA